MAFSILLIEDERLVAENIATILKEASYENISIVSKRKEAINFYQENEVILIISDINLYGQHEGPLIVKELLTLRKCPVIYLTAYSDQQILEDALETEPSASFISSLILLSFKSFFTVLKGGIHPGFFLGRALTKKINLRI